MAQLHERKTDTDREQRAIEVFCEWSKTIYHKLPIQYRADYVVCRGKEVVCLVEVKGRSAEFGKYQECFVAAHKRAEVLILANSMEVPAYMLYTHPNGIYYSDLRVKPKRAYMMQDSRNRDERDFEPVVSWDANKVCRCLVSSREYY